MLKNTWGGKPGDISPPPAPELHFIRTYDLHDIAFETSESQLSNDGSTIKIGQFFDDISPFEITVSNKEISDFLEVNQTLHQQNSIFESKTTITSVFLCKKRDCPI